MDTVWKYKDVRIVETDFRGPDADGKPNGAPIRAYDITPHAGGREFDDSSWEIIGPTTLEGRRTNGRLSFNWYRLNIRIPERIGGFDPTGSTVVFETIVDDYAEVWVDGQLPRELGQSGGSLVAGWNAPNRLVVATNVRAGQRIQLAIFGANGPLSDPPPNYIWIRSAKLEFFRGEPTTLTRFVSTAHRQARPAARRRRPEPGTRIEQLATGFQFIEGPPMDRQRAALQRSEREPHLSLVRARRRRRRAGAHSGYEGHRHRRIQAARIERPGDGP